MKRTCLYSCALTAAVLAPTSAMADQHAPGILYIPTEEVVRYGSNEGPCGSGVNSALGCTGIDATMLDPEQPNPMAADLAMSMQAGLAAYDVMVTTTRPPEYITYLMMFPREAPVDMASTGYNNFECVFAGANCGSRNRNDIFSLSGPTANCLAPELVHAAMYGFGRASGLEAVANPEDWMNYEMGVGPAAGPDYTTPPMDYVDMCNDRVNRQRINSMSMMQEDINFECTFKDHAMCPDGTNGEPGQNSHQDLLLYYGARVEDTEAPMLMNITPEDGAMLEAGESLMLDVDISDSDPIVGARWTIVSDAIAEVYPDGLSYCTNGVCNGGGWPDGEMLKATDSDWSLTLDDLPSGDYVITFEASDYHGNIADTVTLNVTIGGGGTVDESGGNMTTGNTTNDNETGNVLDAGESEESDGGDTVGADGGGDDGGCSCTSGSGRSGAALMLLGLMGLGAMRRRW